MEEIETEQLEQVTGGFPILGLLGGVVQGALQGAASGGWAGAGTGALHGLIDQLFGAGHHRTNAGTTSASPGHSSSRNGSPSCGESVEVVVSVSRNAPPSSV